MSTSEVKLSRVVLIDSNRLYRNALRLMLEAEGIEKVVEFDDIDDARARSVDVTNADVLLLKAQHGADLSGVISGLKDRRLNGKIVLLVDRDFGAASMLSAIATGTDGILISEMSPAAFMQSLRLVCLGEKVLPAELATLLLDRGSENRLVSSKAREIGLSEREIEILRLLARGDSNKEIAIRLDIAEATVKVHVKAVLRKIQVGNRTQAAVWALGHGIVVNDGRRETESCASR